MKAIMNFILKIFELLKSDPKTAIAKYFLYAGAVSKGVGSLSYHFQDADTQQTLTYSGGLDITGYLLVLIGVVLLLNRYFTIKKHAVALAYGQGMANMDIHLPLQAIPKYERFDCIQLNLVPIDSYDRNLVIQNYHFNKTLLGHRVENTSSQKVYVAALGSFPYLFLLGSLLRNAYSHIIIMDFDRHANGGGKWYKLPPLNETISDIGHQLMYEEISIEQKIDELNESEYDEVGIALSYTFQVNKEAIPVQLQGNMLYLKHSAGIGHDKLSNEESQRSLLNELSVYIASLWNKHTKIHMFVSAQSSMCLNIGKSYMNNGHGVLVLHNYDNQSRSYNWSIEFDRGEIGI